MAKKDRSKRIKLIANPLAGNTEEATKYVNSAVSCFQSQGLKVDVALTKPKEEATPIARRASKKGYKAVVAMGGDGTVEAVMRGLMGSNARMGIIPQGTANNVAKSLGIPEKLEEACALIATGKARKVDIGQVKTKKNKKFYFFEMAAIGLAATIYPYSAKLANGKLSKLKDTALTFFHQETRPTVYLTMNDESKVEVQTMMVVVSNTPIFGNNFNVAPLASLDDGLLTISVYPDFSKVELVSYYAAIMGEGYSGEKKVQQYQVAKVKIKTSPKQDIMADGVDLGSGTARIKVLPSALRVFAPEKVASPASPEKEPEEEIKQGVVSLGEVSPPS